MMTSLFMEPGVPLCRRVLIKPSKMQNIFGVVKKALFFEQLFLKVCDVYESYDEKIHGWFLMKIKICIRTTEVDV